MRDVREQVAIQIAKLIDENWTGMKRAYNNGDGMSFTVKVLIEPEGPYKTKITPVLAYYPLPKFQTEKYTVRVDHKQLELGFTVNPLYPRDIENYPDEQTMQQAKGGF